MPGTGRRILQAGEVAFAWDYGYQQATMKTRMLFCLLLVLFGADRLVALDLGPGLDGPPPDPKISAAVKESRLEVTYRIPAGYHMVRQEEFLTFTVETEGYRIGKIEYPAGKKGKSGEEEYTSDLVLTAPLERTVNAATAPKTLNVRAAWQMCDDAGTCLMPTDTTVRVPVDPAVVKEAGDAGGASAKLPAAKAPPAAPPTSTTAPAGPSAPLWLMLVFALVGGLILNLMPCVLPVLSIKALSLVQSAQSDRAEILKGALAYTVGVLACFGVLAGVVVGVKAAGSDVGWGFQFQDWRFVLVLAIMIWIFSLSLFEVFVVTLPGMSAMDAAGRKGGHWGSFLSGAFSVLLATPCTAPLLGSAMGYAFSQPPALIFLFFFTVGAGLALPFLLLGFFPAALKWIPKPGNWMVVFREVMAFLLAGTVVYLLDILYYQIGEGLFAVIWYLLLAALAAWMYGKFANPLCSAGRRWVFTILALVLLIGPLPWVMARGHAGQAKLSAGGHAGGEEGADPETGFFAFSPERIEREIRAGKPVFIDFGARWCATCRVNEEGVLYTSTMRAAFEKHGVLPFHADFTNRDPVIAEWLKRYQRAGVPLYLLFRPGEQEPHVFPEVLTTDMVLRELEKIAKSN
jgi:thiol:disulfide interchange protein DsbD